MEVWTSREALESSDTFKDALAWADKEPATEEEKKHRQARPHDQPASLFNGMLSAVIPYGIRGAIWYQGESNAGRAYQYRTLFPEMIEDWREKWNIGNFPFYWVQLANFMTPQQNPVESQTWPELREAQSMTLESPNTAQAVIIDIGAANDIHPRNKQDVGLRLALPALAQVYGQDVVYSGPVYRRMSVEDGALRLHFDHVGGGLVARGGELDGFALAGEDSVFVWADARIENDTLVLSSPDVPNPVAARYAWADNPVISLYNEEGLPASPFRTDDWKGVTEPR
jgi:sialate O-acetylesterase